MILDSATRASQDAWQFVKQYYPMLENHGDKAHEFYNDRSSIQFVDEGGLTISASSTQEVHNMIKSLQVTATEIKNISSFESCNGCVFTVVKGSLKPENYDKRRKFVQSFVLAPLQGQQTGPQALGYFVLHEVLHLLSDTEVEIEAPTQFVAVSEPLTPVVVAAAEDGSNQTFEHDSEHSTEGIIDVAILVAEDATNKALVSDNVVSDDVSMSPSSDTATSEDDCGSNLAFAISDPVSTIVLAKTKCNDSEAFVFDDVSKIVSEPAPVAAQDVSKIVSDTSLEVAHDVSKIVSEPTPLVAHDVSKIVSEPTPLVAQDVSKIVSEPSLEGAQDVSKIVSEPTPLVAEDVLKIVSEPTPLIAEDVLKIVSEPTPLVAQDISKNVSEPSILIAQGEVCTQATSIPTPQDDKPADNVGTDSINESPDAASEEESVQGEISKISYASILKTARGQLKQPGTNGVNIPQQSAQLPNRFSQTNGNINYSLGHMRTIYVRNLPSEVDTLQVIHMFRKFGKVKVDRIHIMKNYVSNNCNAFVEYDDFQDAQKAIKASPIKLPTGRKIYIEARRSKG